ncbi:MAG: PEP-CTERM sorting domain-containing protein [Phycisphaerales bacterium]
MRTSIGAITALALLATAGAAQAGPIVGTDFTEGSENQTILVDGVNVTLNADPRGVAYQGDGSQGIGVFGGGGDSMIGGVDEFNFAFDVPVFINELQLGMLHALGEDGDIVDEGVKITTDNGSWIVRAFTAPNGTELANQDFGGSIIREGGGSYLLTSLNGAEDEGEGFLFGGPTTSLRLDPVDSGSWPFFTEFTFKGMTITPVPAPGAAAVLGFGGLAVARRRRR